MLTVQGFGDHQVAMNLAAGILAALFKAKMTGEGDQVVVSLFHSAVWDVSLMLQSSQYGADSCKFPMERWENGNPLTMVYKTKDEQWLQIAMPQYGGSCGGGGRYDKMVGKFLGQETPACGFSIGFERIIMIMMDEGFKVPGVADKTAYLIEKGISGQMLSDILGQAQEARKNGEQILVVRMNKNKKFQKQALEEQGYNNFKEFYKNPLN
jgi:hypothetical protein